MNTPLLTERLYLREVLETDIEPMFKLIHHNRNVLKTFLASYHEQITDSIIEPLLRMQDTGNLIYMIELKDTHEVIGLLLEQSHTVDTMELGYALGEPYWNQGYMSEALQVVIEHLKQLQYQRITCQCFDTNIASERVMQKCGLSKTNHVETLFYQNKYHTVIEYEISF